jgi:hypothetical protein
MPFAMSHQYMNLCRHRTKKSVADVRIRIDVHENRFRLSFIQQRKTLNILEGVLKIFVSCEQEHLL